MLEEIGAAHTPRILVLNKVDRLKEQMVTPPGPALVVRISALTGQGIGDLLRCIDQVLPFDVVVTARFRLPAGDGANIYLLHQFGRVLRADYAGELCQIEAEVPESLRDRLAEFLVSG